MTGMLHYWKRCILTGIIIANILAVVVIFYSQGLRKETQIKISDSEKKSAHVINLLDVDIESKATFLDVIEYDLEHANLSSLNPDIWKCAKPAMTFSEKKKVTELLGFFKEVCRENNFNYFMLSGNLVGSYLVHGFLPWDDDVDLLMKHSEREKIISTFEKYVNTKRRDLAIVRGVSGRMKVFSVKDSVPIKSYPAGFHNHRWPFLDITFYYENSTHLWQLKNHLIIPKYLVFPVHLRPFESVLLFAPNDTLAVLKHIYKNPGCTCISYNHKLERTIRSNSIAYDCEEVKGIYPFVHRKALSYGVLETLMLNDKVIHSVITAEPLYAITPPYKIE